MSFDVFWFLPTSGDTRFLGRSESGRPATNAYMRQIAVAADQLGYDGVLIPTGASCLDPWVTAASLVPVTQRIKLLVALRTTLGNPTATARQAASLDEASGGRLLLNVVPGGDATELAADGVFLDHDARYAASDEFLTIWRRLLQGETVDFDGEHHKVQGAQNFFPPLQKPYPPLYFGGSSVAAHELAAKHGRLPELGRASGGGGREDRRRTGPRGETRAHGALRRAPARDRAGDQRGGLGRRRRADQPPGRRHHRRRPGQLRAHGFRRPAAHGRPAPGAA